MFCGNCGNAIKEGAEFCPNCGKPIAEGALEEVNLSEEVYYSKDWSKAEGFAISSAPRFDILITKQNFYLLRMPTSNNATLFLILGLVIMNIIGAVIGSMIGESQDSKRRERYRSTWMSAEEKLTSREYEKAIHMRIPLERVKECISFKKGKRIEVAYGADKIVLKKGNEAFIRLEAFVSNLP